MYIHECIYLHQTVEVGVYFYRTKLQIYKFRCIPVYYIYLCVHEDKCVILGYIWPIQMSNNGNVASSK
jgi:hypothetical protein